MDIPRSPGSRDLARFVYEEVRREVVQESRDRVRGAREDLARLSEVRAQRVRAELDAREEATRNEASRKASAARTDHVEISDRGRILAGDRGDERVARERVERIAELKERFERGQVNTPEAIERAASRLLGGE